MLPSVPPGTPEIEVMEIGKQMDGKPRALVMYKTAYNHSMTRPLIRGFLVDLFLVFSFIYILTRAGTPNRLRIFAGSVALGLVTFLWRPCTMHNWFQTPTEILYGQLIDSLVAWGLVVTWLSW